MIREYVWNGWDPVAVIEGGVISFVRADHIGRPVLATNASGEKVWTATYTPFGGVRTSTGALPTTRFPGQWFQSGEPDRGALQWSDPPANGLHQNWMHDYDPTTGRYLQTDPLGLVDETSQLETTIPNRTLTPTPNPLISLALPNCPRVDTPQIPIPTFRPSWNA